MKQWSTWVVRGAGLLVLQAPYDGCVNGFVTPPVISSKGFTPPVISCKGRYLDSILATHDGHQENFCGTDEDPSIGRNATDSVEWHHPDEISRRDFVAWLSSMGVLSAFYSPKGAFAAKWNGAPETKDTNEEGYDSTLPYSSVRKYKSITLPNGIQVLLVNDKTAIRSSAALTIGGAGQFSDPEDLGGVAHLMEHMTLSASRNRFSFGPSRKATVDFEEWLSDYEGASNGFTAYEKVCFHFISPTDVFQTALERFSGLFLSQAIEKVCRNEETLRREIRRVNGELDSSEVNTKFLYLVKSLFNPEHPYSRFTAGNLRTLEEQPSELGIDVAERLIQFFNERYLPSKAILVVVAPVDFASLEAWVAPFASTLSKKQPVAKPSNVESTSRWTARQFPKPFPEQSRTSPICLFRGKSTAEDAVEKLSFQWALDLDYKELDQPGTPTTVTASQIGFALSQIFGRRGPGSLYNVLKQRRWVSEGSQGIPRISFPVDVSGFQLVKLELSLTLDGFSSRSAVIAAVYDAINSLRKPNASSDSPFQLQRTLVAQYATVAQLYGSALAPRPPDAVELAFDAQIYGIQGPQGVGQGDWYRFPLPQDYSSILSVQRSLAETLEVMSNPSNAIIVITASTQAILRAQANIFDDSLPPLSPASWDIEPITGARYFFENSSRLSGKVNEWLVARLLEDELSPPVVNNLIPPVLRPPRSRADTIRSGGSSGIILLDESSTKQEIRSKFSLGQLVRRNRGNKNEEEQPSLADVGDPARTSIMRDYWAVLQASGFQQDTLQLLLPRAPPEPTGRCAFVLQLLSARPARAGIDMAAAAELWKLSFEYSIEDLAELGAPGGLAYELSFNNYGLRISFLGLSQNIGSYARRLCRRLVAHQGRLLEGPERLPSVVIDTAVRNVNRSPLTLRRKKLLADAIREASAVDAAVEGVSFFKSCSGGVCFSQEDLLPKETVALLGDLKVIFRSVTGSNVRPVPAAPELEAILYRPAWKPRSASSCSVSGAILISDACGRVSR